MATTNIEINGVVDTSNTVLDNINRIADAALSFVTWDLELGKWSVIVQQAETSSRSFDDSNIVGSIAVGGTGVNQTYTSATIRFPHKDLNSNSDFVTVEVSAGERYPNEIDNDLKLNTDLVNDPAHAQQMAAIELKNSRLDQIIQFSTDYTSLGVTAGDVIDVTSAQYGFSGKLYRVITVREQDQNDGTLLIDITAKEFADIYSNSLSRDDRSRETNITPRDVCEEFKEKDAEAVTDELTNSPAVSKLTNELFAFQTDILLVPEILSTTNDRDFLEDFANSYPNNLLDTGYSFQVPYPGKYLISYFCNFGAFMIYDTQFVFFAPDGCRKQIQIYAEVNGVKTQPTVLSDTGSLTGSDTTSILRKQDLLDDLNMEALYRFNAGDNILFKVFAKTDFGPNHPEAVGDPVESQFVSVTGRLFYIGDV